MHGSIRGAARRIRPVSAAGRSLRILARFGVPGTDAPGIATATTPASAGAAA